MAEIGSDQVCKGINALGQGDCYSPNGPEDNMNFSLGDHHHVIYTCFSPQHLQGTHLDEHSSANKNELN